MSKQIVRLMEEKNDLAREVIQLRERVKELEGQNEKLKWVVNDLTMTNMAYEYNEAEAEKFRPEYERQLLEPLTTTLSLIRPLAFRDPNDAAWAMEEIRKVLNAYDKNK